MALLISILVLLMLGLALFQGWQLWYMRRELARLEQRLAESLDDQDLLEFQERLKGLLTETQEASLSLVQTIERRQEAVEKVLARATEAEKRLSIRAQLLELAAKDRAQRDQAEPVVAAPSAKNLLAKKAAPKAKKDAPPAPQGRISSEASAAEAQAKESAAQEEARRSYLSRPAAPATPAAPAANRYQRVYELSDQGLSREQIARESGILPGEVELILNLRPGKRRPN